MTSRAAFSKDAILEAAQAHDFIPPILWLGLFLGVFLTGMYTGAVVLRRLPRAAPLLWRPASRAPVDGERDVLGAGAAGSRRAVPGLRRVAGAGALARPPRRDRRGRAGDALADGPDRRCAWSGRLRADGLAVAAGTGAGRYPRGRRPCWRRAWRRRRGRGGPGADRWLGRGAGRRELRHRAAVHRRPERTPR